MRNIRTDFVRLVAGAVVINALAASPSFADVYGTPMKGSENSAARVGPSDSDDVQSNTTVTNEPRNPVKAEKRSDRARHHTKHPAHLAQKAKKVDRTDRKVVRLTTRAAAEEEARSHSPQQN